MGPEFHFLVYGYTFPEIKTGYDGNFLQTELKVWYQRKCLFTLYPDILTVDIEHISNWFKNITNKKQSKRGLVFIEPNIQLKFCEYKTETAIIGFELFLDRYPNSFVPELMTMSPEGDSIDFNATIEASYVQMKVYRVQFANLYKLYPQRGTFKF